MNKELSPLFGDSVSDSGKYAIWVRPVGSAWNRYSRYTDNLNWICDWAVRSPGSSIDVIMIPASVGVDSDVD